MCENELGIGLKGHRSESLILFRGREIRHFVSSWTGECRYAFDHTTHESIQISVKDFEKYQKSGNYQPLEGPTVIGHHLEVRSVSQIPE